MENIVSYQYYTIPMYRYFNLSPGLWQSRAVSHRRHWLCLSRVCLLLDCYLFLHVISILNMYYIMHSLRRRFEKCWTVKCVQTTNNYFQKRFGANINYFHRVIVIWFSVIFYFFPRKVNVLCTNHKIFQKQHILHRNCGVLF